MTTTNTTPALLSLRDRAVRRALDNDPAAPTATLAGASDAAAIRDAARALLAHPDLRGLATRTLDVLARSADVLVRLASGEKDFTDADLRGANLGGANLRGANLGGADLGRANLRGADLGGANLRGANLGGADLGGANLGGAGLGGADLRGANLRDADLRGANLGGADLGGANLRDADLGGAKNLKPEGMPDALEVRAKVAAHIRLHPELHDQGDWGDGTDNPACGTACCVAGWACHLGGGSYGLSVPGAATLLLGGVEGYRVPSFDSYTSREDILAALDDTTRRGAATG